MSSKILTSALMLLLAGGFSGCKVDNTAKKSADEKGVLSTDMLTNVNVKMSIVNTTVSKTVLTAGETQTASVVLKSNKNISNIEVDIRIYNAAGTLIARKPFSNVRFISGQASTFSFDYLSPAALVPGTYNVQIGVWNASWITYLYETKNFFKVVAPVASTPAPTPAPVIPPPVTTPIPAMVKVSVVSSGVTKTALAPGETQSMNVKLTSATSLSNLIADIRIYNSSNVQITRKEFNVSIAAGGVASMNFDYQLPSNLPEGTYNVQVGVWNNEWLTYLYETRDSFTVKGSSSMPAPVTPAPPVATTPDPVAPVQGSGSEIAVTSATVTRTSIAAGQVQTANVSVYSPVAQPLIVSIKFNDLNGKFLLETAMPTTFAAGQTKLFKMDFALSGDAQPGTYSISVGVFNNDYSKTFLYQSGLAKYAVSAINQPVIVQTPPPANNLTLVSEDSANLFAGPYFVQNNMWGTMGLAPGSYWQRSGIGPLTANKSISARWQWSFPNGPNEVKGYPAIGYGKKPGMQSTPGSNLPKLVDSVISSVSSWDVQAAYTGKGHLTFDLWLTRDANNYPSFPSTPITHEIMLTLGNFGGYGSMRNPAWYFGSTIIDGITYRVWKADNFGGGGITWRFIVLQMVNPVQMPKGSVDFKHVFTYLKSVGLITGQEYYSSLEFGNEMEEGTGDVYVKDFKADVQ